jgi:exosome complex component RRP42
LAAKFALAKATFPKLLAKADDEGRIEIDIQDDNGDEVTLNVADLPYSVSVCKIGNSYVVDADLKEESVTKVRITFGFDSSNNIRYTSKDGFGSLDPDTLYSIIDVRSPSFLLLYICFVCYSEILSNNNLHNTCYLDSINKKKSRL